MVGHECDNDNILSSNEKRFEQFLEYRGIKRVPKSTDVREENQSHPRESRQSHNLFSSSDDELADEINTNVENHNLGIFDVDNLSIDINDERVIDYFGLSRVEENPDADDFYRERRDSFPSDEFNEIDLGIDNDDDACISMKDKDIQYVAFNKFGDRRYGNFSKEGFKYESSGAEVNNKFPANSQIAYINWEAHDSITQLEIANSNGINEDETERNGKDDDNDDDDGNAYENDSDKKVDSKSCKVWEGGDGIFVEENSITERNMIERKCAANGGLYDPHRSAFTEIEDTDPTRLVILSPAQKYRDLTRLDPLGVKKLANLDNVRKYKNNISTIISDSKGNSYLVTCANSDIIIFDFDPISQLPNHFPVFRFDTKPTFTSTTDRLISTWPYFPHTINFIKSDIWLGKPILGACLDDGTLLIWFVETIMEQVSKFSFPHNDTNEEQNASYTDQNRFFGIKITPDFKLKMEASLWGLDFLSYKDDKENLHNLIAASDNSQSITLFYYHQRDKRFYHIKSHQVLHNIPEVSFLSSDLQEEVHRINVACASISGELIVFRIKFTLSDGPLDKDEYEYFKNEPMYYVDSTMAHIENREENRHPDEDLREAELRMKRFHRVVFTNPTVINRVLLDEDCWTCKPISLSAFKQVQSIRAMTGDHRINEKEEIKHIMNESEILNFQYDPVKTSHLGLSAYWQFFESPVLNLSNNLDERDPSLETAKLTGIDDDYRRIHKGIDNLFRNQREQDTKRKSLNGKDYWSLNKGNSFNILAVSTSKKLGLFRADTLFCNSATKKLFDLSIPFSDESKFSNRISITHVIPALLCFIAVTQQGLISIMRLCEHRGLYGMRQEHIFPNALTLALGSRGYRTITGLAVRNMSLLQYHRYFIYVTYTDGIIVAYQLSLNNLLELVLLQV